MSFLSQPYLLTNNPQNEMYVLWISKTKGEGILEYGALGHLANKINAQCYEITGLLAPKEDGTYSPDPAEHKPVSVWQFIAKIDGLKPDQKIFYRVKINEEATKIYDFHTAPEKGENFRFAQLSDLQGLGECYKAVHKIGCTHPDFMLYSGDATYTSWRIDSWFDTGEDWQSEESKKTAFFPCMQQENGARLMQYAPLFFCPGNHELDDIRCYIIKELGEKAENWSWHIFRQFFRPLYPDTDTTVTGQRWYSADYGDLHIISLNINRFCCWDSLEYPGWRVYDSIAPDSPQITWLKRDLEKNNSKFKWVIQHFHFLNKGADVQFNFCDPVIDEKRNVTYPYDHAGDLMDLYSDYGVNAVTYGHSHVYERYYRKSTHYIEAAYLSVCFRNGGEPNHPSGLIPIVENNSKPSFLIVERNSGGLFAKGYFAEETPVIFDEYQIADKNGKTVAP